MYWDFGLATEVFDRQGRRGLLVFELDKWEGRSVPDTEQHGWVSLDLGNKAEPRFVRLSDRTTWGAAKPVVGSMRSGVYRGPNVPADFRGSGADVDAIVAMLSAASLA